MATFNLSNRVKIVNTSPNVDSDYGPYASILAATTALPLALRVAGKTIGIYSGTSVVEYWWKDDATLSSDPLIKAGEQDLQSVTTKGSTTTTSITAASLIKDGGQSSQFLKADGSVDNNTYLTAANLPSTLTLYATTVSAGINGYSKLVTTVDDPDYPITAVPVTTGVITGAEQFISGLVSNVNLINGNPGVFNVTTIGQISRTDGSGTAEFYFTIYKRTSAGVETLIGTSGVTLPVTNGGYSEFQATAIWNDGVFVNTDRIVIKYYANRISGGSNPTYSFLFGGSASPVRTIVPIPTAVIPNIYLADLADVEDVTPLNNEILYYNTSVSLWEHSLVNDLMPNATSSVTGKLLNTDWANFNTAYTNRITSTGGAPLSISSNIISIAQANDTTNGYLTFNDWNVFNSKQNALSGTGFIKISGTVLSYDNTNYTPTTRSLTINGTAYDLSADRAWTIPTYSLPVSTSSILGGVKIGDGVNVTVDGTISVSTNYQAPLSLTGIVKSTAGTISYLTDNTANWDTAYNERNNWNGGSTNLVAADGRTSLGASTVGSNIFTSTNPSAITFLQANANNTVSWLSATSFRAAIGAGTGVGSVTSVAALNLTSTSNSDLTSSVANGTAAAVITLNVPDAGTGSRGVVTTGVQTFAGNKTFVGSSIFKGTSVNDGPILGSEMLTTASVSTNWVGTSFANGYQHTAGNTSVLQDSQNLLTDSVYQVQYTISYTSSPAGTFTISVGGATSPSKSSVGTGYYTALTTSTTPLTITPSTTFNGKVIVSLKILNPASSVMTIQSSNGVVRNEFRYSSTGLYNMFLGVNSGGYNSSANFNTFVGFNSGRLTSTGSSNTALGGKSLYSNTTGYSNVALGSNALYSNLTGNNNTVIGDQVLLSNIDGYNNQGLGSNSLVANTSGYSNVGVGVNSLSTNTTGHDNVAIGEQALQYNDTGYYNIALGTNSGSNIVGGSNNIVIGYSTTTQAASDQSSIVIGTAVNGLGSNTTVIGNGSTVKTGIFGRTLIGSSTLPTDDLSSALQVNGYVSATGYKVPSQTGFLKADGTVDNNTYSTGGGTTTGTNTGDETAARIGVLINGSTNAVPNNTDYVATSDATTPLLKKITWTNVKTFLKTYFDTLYSDKAYNIYIFTTVSIDTEHPGTYNGSGTYTQNGRNVMIQNTTNAIDIVCASGGTSDFIASYTKLGTTNITFQPASGVSNLTAFGSLFTLSGAVGSTALLTRNGTGQYYLQINNL